MTRFMLLANIHLLLVVIVTPYIVEPPFKRPRHTHSKWQIPGLLCNIQFVVVTFLSARVEFMK